MGTPLYNKLKPLDEELAAEYQKIIGVNAKTDPKKTIDMEGAQRLLEQAADKDVITSQEAEALALLYDSGVFTDEVQKAFEQALLSPGAMNLILKGTAVPILDVDQEMKDFISAIDKSGTSVISFYSPGTKFTYTAAHYQAIKELGKKGGREGILLMRVVDHELYDKLDGPGAIYDSKTNKFFFFQHSKWTAITRDPLIIHEATHAIQDWNDILSVNKYVEADAYIAQAVSGAFMGGKQLVSTGDMNDVAFTVAAPLVRAGKATPPTGKDFDAWKDAYMQVVKAVEKHPVYKKIADVVADMTAGENAKVNEKAIFQALTKVRKP
jgi:hypothetical protein